MHVEIARKFAMKVHTRCSLCRARLSYVDEENSLRNPATKGRGGAHCERASWSSLQRESARLQRDRTGKIRQRIPAAGGECMTTLDEVRTLQGTALRLLPDFVQARALRRNQERFPAGFMFQLTEEEHQALYPLPPSGARRIGPSLGALPQAHCASAEVPTWRAKGRS